MNIPLRTNPFRSRRSMTGYLMGLLSLGLDLKTSPKVQQARACGFRKGHRKGSNPGSFGGASVRSEDIRIAGKLAEAAEIDRKADADRIRYYAFHPGYARLDGVNT